MILPGNLCLSYKHLVFFLSLLSISAGNLRAQDARMVYPDIPYAQYAPLYLNDTLWYTVNRGGYEFVFFQYAPGGILTNAPQLFGQGATAGIANNTLYFYSGEKYGEIYERHTGEKIGKAQNITSINQQLYITRNGQILRQTENKKWENVPEFRDYNTVSGLFFDGKYLFFGVKILAEPYKILKSEFSNGRWQPAEPLDTAVFKTGASHIFYTAASDTNYWFSSNMNSKVLKLYQVGGLLKDSNIVESIVVFTDTTYFEMVEFNQAELKRWNLSEIQIIDGVLTIEQRKLLLEAIKNDTTLINDRKTYLSDKLALPESDVLHFYFYFTDDSYNSALTLSADEVTLFQFDSTSVIDGVLTAEARNEIIQMLAGEGNSIQGERKNYILEKLDAKESNLVNFVFAFTDDNMETGISFTTQEADLFGINNETVIDGVLTQAAINNIVSRINTDNKLPISLQRKDDICRVLGCEGEVVSFVFAFADETMENGISFTREEADILHIDSTTVIDGVLTQAAINNIIMRINSDQSLAMSLQRKTDICAKLECGGSLIQFVFAFTDDKMDNGITFTPDEASIFKLDSHSIVDGVLTPLAKQIIVKQVNEYQGLKIDKNRKEFLREKLGEVNVSTNLTFEGNSNLVVMQIGAYRQPIDSFYDHLLKSGFIQQEDYIYLKQFELTKLRENDLYKYRIKIPITEIPRLIKIIHFDNPFRL